MITPRITIRLETNLGSKLFSLDWENSETYKSGREEAEAFFESLSKMVEVLNTPSCSSCRPIAGDYGLRDEGCPCCGESKSIVEVMKQWKKDFPNEFFRGMKELIPCPNCNGEGMVGGLAVKCSPCRGTGVNEFYRHEK